MALNTFSISGDGKSITCLVCNTTSHHPMDVRFKFCGKCHVFVEDRDHQLRVKKLIERDISNGKETG